MLNHIAKRNDLRNLEDALNFIDHANALCLQRLCDLQRGLRSERPQTSSL